ncbi:conserved hypothetical protein [Theileria orientalis strain Shintoku]|uniref:Uncharacterized protein n=1 Tax=Theileria orientalis strain Shintoku TaxID=869250 RepID=J4DNF2_THEOR|nr:conserved hypothetical protein [Theileria orientalis strain Shintoku]BAM38854.1 conserved hypothetical protein [Theileria orientalis strain Shintoku]|eukprot:XP_009689155.1 conserved hypothetical protein [Theileria orientalis strain Shintoku]
MVVLMKKIKLLGIVTIIGWNVTSGMASKAGILMNKQIKNETVDVSGYVKIADKMFRATCNCPSHIKSLEEMVYRSKTLCRPSKIKVRTHGVKEKADAEVIQAFKYLPPKDFVYIAEQHFSTMDGRSSHKSYYCPGGDLGMLVEVLLNMFETTEKLSESVITEMMKEYLKTLPENTKFYHSTDQSSVENMCKSLEWEVIDLHNIDHTNQNKVKNILIQNIGDYYIKYLYELYRNDPVKNRIIIWTVWAYFNILWDKSEELNEKLFFEILHGNYNPQLLIEISISHGCEIYGIFPKVESRVGDRQFLVFSEYSANVRKNEVSRFVYKYFMDNLNHNFNLTLDQYAIQLNKNG